MKPRSCKLEENTYNTHVYRQDKKLRYDGGKVTEADMTCQEFFHESVDIKQKRQLICGCNIQVTGKW